MCRIAGELEAIAADFSWKDDYTLDLSPVNLRTLRDELAKCTTAPSMVVSITFDGNLWDIHPLRPQQRFVRSVRYVQVIRKSHSLKSGLPIKFRASRIKSLLELSKLSLMSYNPTESQHAVYSHLTHFVQHTGELLGLCTRLHTTRKITINKPTVIVHCIENSYFQM